MKSQFVNHLGRQKKGSKGIFRTRSSHVIQCIEQQQALNVNIQIIRIFTRIRQMLMDNTELRLEIEKIKTKLDSQGKNMEIIFRYLDELIERKIEPLPRKRIGYKSDDL
ncbi:MAG: hypothetical protein Q8S11_08055 [Daejeonella sp.]|uniref:hypothetical protein n=1 Tax=Daejeonella sp. TaxID=2805397 RepID=UPI0027365A37|nr:hypothetical protein [Daejeonella sp.]MDP3468272.1 hypothetical protein [Daejeonella sp.]